jgi:hypothetical protein
VTEVLRHAEALSVALDRLAIPSHGDAAIDWPGAIVAIDAMGEAAFRVSELAKHGLLPNLLALKNLARNAQQEIATLETAWTQEAKDAPMPVRDAALELFDLAPTPAPPAPRRRAGRA